MPISSYKLWINTQFNANCTRYTIIATNNYYGKMYYKVLHILNIIRKYTLKIIVLNFVSTVLGFLSGNCPNFQFSVLSSTLPTSPFKHFVTQISV